LLRDIAFQPVETDAQEFTVSYWKIDPGHAVAEGQELLVVESVDEKTALVVPSPYTGVLAEIVAQEENTIGRGSLLGRIEVP
jgi:pyruvate/2-oxoglutarate dehydrogenase complex dihydrolipoamide acyltransferase (E2) component